MRSRYIDHAAGNFFHNLLQVGMFMYVHEHYILLTCMYCPKREIQTNNLRRYGSLKVKRPVCKSLSNVGVAVSFV
jgi:hypothetical protein